MDLDARISQQFNDSIATKQAALPLLTAPLVAAIEAITQCFARRGKLLICGNGGSAADAQHLAAELVGRFEIERGELAAIALTTDSSILTAVANDYHYDQVFARQVRALGRAEDILLAISTSGNSANVLTAIAAAQKLGMRVIALTGKYHSSGGGAIAKVLGKEDMHLCVPSERTARIQEVHLLLIHCLCDGIDNILSGGN